MNLKPYTIVWWENNDFHIAYVNASAAPWSLMRKKKGHICLLLNHKPKKEAFKTAKWFKEHSLNCMCGGFALIGNPCNQCGLVFSHFPGS